MAESQFPAEQDDPDDVADERADAGLSSGHRRPAERPDHVIRDPECRDTERNRNDQNERHQPAQHVSDRHPDSAEYKPDDVQNHPHTVNPPVDPLPRAFDIPVPASADPVQDRPSKDSSPTVRPGGSEAMPRTARSTPGMNEARSRESCLIVRVSPTPPSSTSWWATSPASLTECTRTSSTVVPRAPGDSVVVASGLGPRPADDLAAWIMAAVLAAVPDGASTFCA